MNVHAQVPDPSECEREPIHIPGSIQPHGVLMALDGNMSIVLRHSVNASEMMWRFFTANPRS